jgi:hypothetical protein
MPFMKKDPKTGKSVRDYKKENLAYNSKPEQRQARSERTVLRRQTNEAGITHKGDNTNLDHVKALSKGGANKMSNTRVVSESVNKSFSRNADSSMKKNDGAARARAKKK